MENHNYVLNHTRTGALYGATYLFEYVLPPVNKRLFFSTPTNFE